MRCDESGNKLKKERSGGRRARRAKMMLDQAQDNEFMFKFIYVI
jgi:hypothetical protein